MAYADFEKMDPQFGRRLVGSGKILATEFQRVGQLKAIAQIDSSGIGKRVANTNTELIGKRSIGRRELWYFYSRGQGSTHNHLCECIAIIFHVAHVNSDETNATPDIRLPAGTDIKVVPDIHHDTN